MIELIGLKKTFDTAAGPVTALRDVNLSIQKGEIFGIIGMSGAGKTTLVRCINHLIAPTEGTVLVDGVSLGGLNQRQLSIQRRDIGMIFQSFNLLMQKNVEKNVLLPMEIAGIKREEAKKRAKELLEIVGLSDKIKNYPSQLSGGQRQRVAIARALTTNPKVLLCDEATSALDPMTTRSILELLKEINQRLGITIVIITHQMEVIKEICTRVAVMDGSTVVEEGPVEDVFQRPKTPAALKLFLNENTPVEQTGGRIFRITFDGENALEPIIANMVIACKAPVSILFGDIQQVNNGTFGQLVIQFPKDEEMVEKGLAFLNQRGVVVKEVDEDDI
ncbi:ATP-binding cassette domain-containing protein [Eubacteriales bacterium OttesenSCG-928-M02]|nr:ATP-binding cassette domain-containing protein [Eubacteriales bacterium OttesenSCG-928-M02]